MSPGSLPIKGILCAKLSNIPMPIRRIPKIIKLFPNPCIISFCSAFLSPNKCTRNSSGNICHGPLPDRAPF